MSNKPPGILGTTGDVHAPAANTAAVVTYGAVTGRAHVVSGVSYSYSAAPTGGNLQVKDGSDVILDLDISAAGEGAIYFDPPKKNTAGNAMSATLAAGGAGISGKVSVLGHWKE